MIGNFNEITSQDKKVGGRLRLAKQMTNFRSVLKSNGLLDFGWKRQKFTWSNRHQDESHTKERLDKAVANKFWLDTFGSRGMEALTSG